MRRMGEGGLRGEGMRSGRSPKWAGWPASSSAGGAGTFSTSAWYVVSAKNVNLIPWQVIYLYGDLAIYGAAVAKSVRDVTCTFRPNATVTALNISENAPCWPGSNQSRLSAYRVILALFTCTIGQFVFCNVTKTKYLQMVTTLMRWAAFLIMVALACVALSSSSPASPPPTR